MKGIFVSGNHDLLNVPKKRIGDRRICANHFKGRFKVTSRLTKAAIQTIDMPCFLGKFINNIYVGDTFVLISHLFKLKFAYHDR